MGLKGALCLGRTALILHDHESPPSHTLTRPRCLQKTAPPKAGRLPAAIRLRCSLTSAELALSNLGELHTQFCVSVECGEQHWCIKRRFAEFVALAATLSFNEELPVRHGLGIEPSVVERRTRGLHEWLQHVLEQWQWDSSIAEFLQLPSELQQLRADESLPPRRNSIIRDETPPSGISMSDDDSSPVRVWDNICGARRFTPPPETTRASDAERYTKAFSMAAFCRFALSRHGCSLAMVHRFASHIITEGGVQAAHIICAIAYLSRLEGRMPSEGMAARDQWQLTMCVLIDCGCRMHSCMISFILPCPTVAWLRSDPGLVLVSGLFCSGSPCKRTRIAAAERCEHSGRARCCERAGQRAPSKPCAEQK